MRVRETASTCLVGAAITALQDAAPSASLGGPFKRRRQRSYQTFVDSLTTAVSGGQEEQFFLDVRSQAIQVHDLRHPRLGHMGEPGQLRLVPHLSLAEEPVEVDGQGHQARNPG